MWARVTQSGRGQLWQDLGQIFKMAPLSGIGMNDEVLQNAVNGVSNSAAVDLSLSNTFLRVLVQVGLPGLLIFAAFLVLWYAAGFTLLRKCGRKEGNTVLHLGFMASLTGLLLAGNLTYLWSDSRLLLLFWMCAGIAAALRRLAKRNEEKTEPIGVVVVRDGVQCLDMELDFAESDKKE